MNQIRSDRIGEGIGTGLLVENPMSERATTTTAVDDDTVDVEEGTESRMEIPAALRRGQDEFVSTWGQMGATWGIPRTMAEIHALLFIVGHAMCTDGIMERLGISRGSASMSLKSLLDWGIVSRTHRRGDRKEYFKAEQDVWKLFRTIIRERKRREIDPALSSLRHCRSLTADSGASRKTSDDRDDGSASAEAVRIHNRRVDEMIDFLQIVDVLTDKFISPNGKGLRVAAGILGKVI